METYFAQAIAFLQHVYNTTTWDQIALGLLGVTAIRLSQHHEPKYQKLSPIFGLCGQPFWFYATYQKELWIMFLLCMLYTYAWWKGFKRWYLVKQ